MTNKHNYCVILAGGKGRRLWPCSREQRPKQFIDFFGTGRTQLQQTYDRFAKIVPPENILVNTNAAYLPLVREQLPELAPQNIMAEPLHRNTAASAFWAMFRVLHLDPEANLVIAPSDQAVQQEQAFAGDMATALQFVATHDGILTMGIRPTRPEPGYGYIQMGEELGDSVFHVQSFTEKPEREFAQMFLESGEFLWNTGLYVVHARYGVDRLSRVLPMVLRNYDKEREGRPYSIDEENAFIRENFPSYPNLSLDSCVFDHGADDVSVLRCSFGWADLGTWHSLYEAMHKGEGDNVVIDSDVLMDNAHGNVVKLPKGRMAVINGLDGYIVAENDNVLLICRKEDSSALVRKMVNEVQMKRGDAFV